MKKKSDESISSLLTDDQIIASGKETSNHFNKFFTSVAEKIKKKFLSSQKYTINLSQP